MAVARCGKSGLEEYRRVQPDLTLVQDLIPSLHGFDVCREIKRSEGGEIHPVVLLCGPTSHSALVNTGCDAYIQKPFDDDQLLEVLNQLLPPASRGSAVDGLSPVCTPSVFGGDDVDAFRDTDRAYSESLELEITERIEAALELDLGPSAPVMRANSIDAK